MLLVLLLLALLVAALADGLGRGQYVGEQMTNALQEVVGPACDDDLTYEQYGNQLLQQQQQAVSAVYAGDEASDSTSQSEYYDDDFVDESDDDVPEVIDEDDEGLALENDGSYGTDMDMDSHSYSQTFDPAVQIGFETQYLSVQASYIPVSGLGAVSTSPPPSDVPVLLVDTAILNEGVGVAACPDSYDFVFDEDDFHLDGADEISANEYKQTFLEVVEVAISSSAKQTGSVDKV